MRDLEREDNEGGTTPASRCCTMKFDGTQGAAVIQWRGRAIQPVPKLIDLGKEKGYVLYDDVTDLLPEEMSSGPEADDLLRTGRGRHRPAG